MKRTFAFSTALLIALAACGGGEPASQGGAAMGEAEAAEAGGGGQMASSTELSMPDWYHYDEATNSVTLDIVAGQTSDNNYWNFNGYTHGDVTVVVPVGASVTIDFSNKDPNMAHSIGVASFTDSPPAMVPPNPVFDGAISSNPTDQMNATKTDTSETVSFTASTAGDYSLTCFVPGHAVAGMWIHFAVSDSGEAGVRGAM